VPANAHVARFNITHLNINVTLDDCRSGLEGAGRLKTFPPR
jgi:hypothetical protein